MVELERGQYLHHRSCDGEALTAEEQDELQSWYSQMDTEEEAMLRRKPSINATIEDLRLELRQRMRELEAAVGDVRRIEAGNEQLRQQIGELRQQLVAKGILVS